MDNLDTELILAFQQGNLLASVYETLRSERAVTESLCESLTRLHNSGEIDVISSFQQLKNEPPTAIDFFSTRRVLEKTLPKLKAAVLPVMECVLQLVNEAGRDMAAGLLLPPFVDFCAVDESRPVEALALIEESIDKYVELLPPVIVAGARIDTEFYLRKSIQLSKHQNLKMRQAAIFSIGRIENLEGKKLIDEAVACLETSAQIETDDQLLGNVIQSAFNLYKLDRSQDIRVTAIIKTALSKGKDLALHIAAELISFDHSLVPDILLDVFVVELLRVNPENKGTLNKIDYGISQLLEHNTWDKGIEFLEKLLLKNSETLSLAELESTSHELFRNVDALSRLTTNWFLKGNPVLCDGIRTIAELAYEQDLRLVAVPSEFASTDPMQMIFLARKSIGYLFSKPITVASIVISLLEYAIDADIQKELANLLFDPLLLNYPGQLKDYLTKKSDHSSEPVKENIKRSIRTLDQYFEHLKSMGSIPELHPSQAQREAYRRHFSRLMSESMENAKKDSVFLSLVSTSVILYGSTSIDYVYGVDGATNRMEIPLQSHSTTVEVPRTGNIDSFGLDYMLRVFRAEQLKKS